MNKELKIWDTGKRVEWYIDKFMSWMEEYDLSIGAEVSVKHNKQKGKVLIFLGNENNFEELSSKEVIIMMKILLMFNIVSFSDSESHSEEITKNDQLFLQNYRVSSVRKNWRETFIKSHKNFVHLDKDELGEDDDSINHYIFDNHKKGLYSFFWAFGEFHKDKKGKYSTDEKKLMDIWTIKEIFKDFDNELKSLCLKIYRRSKPVIRISDMESIDWKDLKIENLKFKENDELESKIWNLANILASGKNISIPIMQRKYVWPKELIKRLLDDIFEIDVDDKKFHFIGSIVYREKDKDMRILDGQQRLTTMFLILTAICGIYFSEDSKEAKISIPSYLKTLFPWVNKNQRNDKCLYNRFKHITGNEDFENFHKILENGDSSNSKASFFNSNFILAQDIINERFLALLDEEKQVFLDDVFQKTVERVAFTITKNQVESEYSIFAKLNTLSEPLNQIDLLKNQLLPYCKEAVLDDEETAIQQKFYDEIYKKFSGKNSSISEPSVKKFIKYFVSLYQNEHLEKGNKKLNLFDKVALIIRNKWNIEENTLNEFKFGILLKNIGQEIESFLSITDKSFYTQKNNMYYEYSDILLSFDQRYVYAPLIKSILVKGVKKDSQLDSSTEEGRKRINKIREVLFEIERYELFFQVVLYRGQSISKIIEKIINEVSNYEEITKEKMRKIFSMEKILSNQLLIPEIETFAKQVSEQPTPNKVSVLILNRMKFFYNNNESIKLTTTFNVSYLKKPTREHILPQKIDTSLREEIFSNSSSLTKSKTFNDDEFNKLHKEYLDFIGNIILVESSDNSKLSNKSSKAKAKIYKSMNYLQNDPSYNGLEKNRKENKLSLPQKIDLQELGFENIKERSELISKYLEKIYS